MGEEKKYIHQKQEANQSVGLIDDQGAKEAPKEDTAVAEKLNEFFESVFTAEDIEEIPTPQSFLLGDRSE